MVPSRERHNPGVLSYFLLFWGFSAAVFGRHLVALEGGNSYVVFVTVVSTHGVVATFVAVGAAS